MTRALLVLALGVGLGTTFAAIPANRLGATPGGAPTMSRASAVTALPGVVLYLANPHNYESGATQTLALSTFTSAHRRILFRASNTTIGLACFSPDGSQIAYFRGTQSGAAAIDVMDLATRKVTSVFKLGKRSGFITGLAWAGNGTDLIVGSTEPPQSTSTHTESALWRVPVSGGPATRITPYEDAGSPATAPNGDLVYVISKTYSSTTTYKKSALIVANPDGTDPRQIISSPQFIAGPTVSPNGQTIAFSITVDTVTSHLEEVGLGGGRATNLTRPVNGRSDLLPAWSPDGSHILFLSSRAGRYDTNKENQLLDAYVMTVVGTEVTKAIWYSDSMASLDLIAWSPAVSSSS